MKKNKIEKLLDAVDFPSDLKKIPAEKLPELCREIREFLISSVSVTGGHFGSNLGVVELTVALHYVFDTPKDLLVWDVGHQAYPHKILTGRKGRMSTIRQKKGLAPFPKREESEYDPISVGHSSTSISVATGMALANRKKKNAPKVVAIIGDGALTGGIAFEGLNHAGNADADILVILNDNKMSISPNVGGLNDYLTRLISSPAYANFRSKGREILDNVPTVKDFVRRAEIHAKGMMAPSTLFEELGFEYFGPIDGHDISMLLEVLSNLKKVKGPKLLHVITKKGKGYAPAENDRCYLHAVSPFDPKTGNKNGSSKKSLTYTDVFSDWILEKARKDKNLHSITPAMCEGSGLLEFSRKFPARFHDVGIAEQHAVVFAAGLATQGKKPVVSIYSSFLQRAVDQLIHDVSFQNLDLLFAVDRSGIVGPDGATHAGSFDLTFARAIPRFVIMAPSSLSECYAMLDAGYDYAGPAIVRYPRDSSPEGYDKKKSGKITIGKAKIIRTGNNVAILSFGALLDSCRFAVEKLDATLVDMRFVKPLDEELLKKLAKTHKFFVTVEDNAIAGGAGSAVNEFVARENLGVRLRNMGLPDSFSEHGTRAEILSDAGLSAESIRKTIEDFIKG